MERYGISDIRNEIREVLFAEPFKTAWKQTHHHYMTVAAHSVRTTCICLKIADIISKVGIKVHRREMIRGALCHDLGILGRDEKFANNIVCCFRHPGDSVKVYREQFGEPTAIEEDMMRHHMWPVTIVPPHTREGFILTLADKLSSIDELIGHIKIKMKGDALSCKA